MSSTTHWWLSFADDDCCRGVVIVRADSFLLAVKEVHTLGISPGGQVAGFLVPDVCDELMEEHSDRLLTKEEAKALDQKVEECLDR